MLKKRSCPSEVTVIGVLEKLQRTLRLLDSKQLASWAGTDTCKEQVGAKNRFLLRDLSLEMHTSVVAEIQV